VPPLVLLLLIAVLAGIAVAVQGQFMGTIDRTAGTATSMLITYGIGALVAAAIWLMNGRPTAGLRQLPWYAWTAGLFGLVIVGGIGYAAPRLGLARTLVVTVAAQLLAALVIDHFGLFGAAPRAIDGRKIAGLLVTIAGVWLVVHKP
jgi:bacterial/archaeal transporter family-2 protein